MKRFIALAAALVLLATLCACQKTKEDLKFYVVSADLLSSADLDGEALLKLAKKKGRIAFTGANIKGYLWAEHRVQLQDINALGNMQDGGSRLFQAGPEDLFVMAIGNRVIYAGGFAAGSGSVNPPRNPYIQDENESVFAIRYDSRYGTGEDPRGSARLYDYLADQQLLISRIQ